MCILISSPAFAVALNAGEKRVTKEALCRADPDLWEGWEVTPTPTRPIFHSKTSPFSIFTFSFSPFHIFMVEAQRAAAIVAAKAGEEGEKKAGKILDAIGLASGTIRALNGRKTGLQEELGRLNAELNSIQP
jgi:hypothetical protein